MGRMTINLLAIVERLKGLLMYWYGVMNASLLSLGECGDGEKALCLVFWWKSGIVLYNPGPLADCNSCSCFCFW